MKLTGKVALVSGAGGGIGRAICLAFAEAEAAVACWDIDAASADETAVLPEIPEGVQSRRPAMFPFSRRPKPPRRRRTRHSGGSISWLAAPLLTIRAVPSSRRALPIGTASWR